MTRREEMVEKAAHAEHEIDGHRIACVAAKTCRINDADRELARAILDAVLPQVTTVAELEALPDQSVVLDGRGAAWEKQESDHVDEFIWNSCGTKLSSEELSDRAWEAHRDAMLTVVWLP